jgi:micrococcal nuclease
MTFSKRVRIRALFFVFPLGFALGASLVATGCSQTGARSEPAPAAVAPAETATAAADQHATASKSRAKVAPTELFEVVKVVDGDTIHVLRNGKVEKLRLLSVDTEEQISGGSANPNSTKPPTVFGEECALWAREYFAGLHQQDGKTRVGLAFPHGVEKHDAFGRLLCDVILPDGTNYNLMLVEKGKSPYFDKYGWSETDHEAFVAAQKSAQAQKIGIWDPHTNAPTTPGVPAAKRPYDKLVPWWDARAVAVDAFRHASAKKDANVVDAEDPKALAAAVQSGDRVRIFGEIGAVKDQPDGAVQVDFRATSRNQALVVIVPPSALKQAWSFDLRAAAQEFHQNYVWLDARIVKGPGTSFRATAEEAKDWKLAGPEVR